MGAELLLVERLSVSDEGIPAMEILSQCERQLTTALGPAVREITPSLLVFVAMGKCASRYAHTTHTLASALHSLTDSHGLLCVFVCSARGELRRCKYLAIAAVVGRPGDVNP